MALSLAQLVSPVSATPASSGGAGGMLRPFSHGDLVRAVCPIPATKLLELRATPLPINSLPQPVASSWRSLTETLLSTVPRYDAFSPHARTPIKSYMGMLLARGDRDEGFIKDGATVRSRLREVYGPSAGVDQRVPASVEGKMMAAWNPWPWDCVSSADYPALPSQQMANSLTVVANRSNGASWLASATEKAAVMRASGAYLHWYEKYGFSPEDIDACIETCRGVVADYAELAAE